MIHHPFEREKKLIRSQSQVLHSILHFYYCRIEIVAIIITILLCNLKNTLTWIKVIREVK